MNASARTTKSRVVTPSGPQRRRRSSARKSAATPYDFRRPVKLSRENSRTLQIAFDTYARQISTVLTSALRVVCHVDLVGFEQQTYTEYVDALGDLTHMTVFSVETMQSSGVLQMPLSMAMACVDRLLGGSGTGEQQERPLTDLETSVVAGLYDRLVAEVRYAFSSVGALEPVVLGVEYSPQLAQIANASDAMIVARLQVRRGEVQHPMTLCFSFNAVIALLAAAGADAGVSERERAHRQQASARLAAGFQEVPVEVAIRFRGTFAGPEELAGLTAGDVVRLEHPAQAPLDVMAADVVFAHATAGTRGQKLAALVVAAPGRLAPGHHPAPAQP